jgi:hypothetical protein
MRWLLLLCAVYGVARGDPHVAPPDPALRKADWCNWSFANNETFPSLIDCKASVAERHSEHGGIWAFRELRFVSATYGDLTGDGAEDALLAIEETQRPVLIQAGKPTTSAEFWLMAHQADGSFVIYTSESADAVPSKVEIANGVATLQWRDHGKTCVEHWRFKREGEAATKTPRQCTP